MWLVAHIHALGVQPQQFAHETYQAYTADLTRQYDDLKRSRGREEVMRARIAARAIVYAMGLERAAGDAVPAFHLSKLSVIARAAHPLRGSSEFGPR
jgi:hypothetical protein